MYIKRYNNVTNIPIFKKDLLISENYLKRLYMKYKKLFKISKVQKINKINNNQ